MAHAARGGGEGGGGFLIDGTKRLGGFSNFIRHGCVQTLHLLGETNLTSEHTCGQVLSLTLATKHAAISSTPTCRNLFLIPHKDVC